MLESAHKLFDIENPLGKDTSPVAAPSRHRLTRGQELRGKWARWYETQGLRDFVRAEASGGIGRFTFSFREVGESWVVLVHECFHPAGREWKESNVPADLPEATGNFRFSGAWLKTSVSGDQIPPIATLDGIRSLLASSIPEGSLATDGSSAVEGLDRGIIGILIEDRDKRLHFLLVLSGNKAIHCAPVFSDDAGATLRTPDHQLLAGKKVGIVGLGSAGSKIALTLARSGVGEFYLVDHDILLPENLVRNGLDWQGVAAHKVDAVGRALSNIKATIKIEKSRIFLTGQESSAVVDGVLARLSECDLLIDATANPRMFNLMAAVWMGAGKPIVWLEVFGGGIGGLVARSRPGVDPSPHDMRAVYLSYCAEHPVPAALQAPTGYSLERAEGDVLAAGDPEVAVIAHHAARFAVDILLPRKPSIFPHSMYLVGLAADWVFSAPYATIPIDVSNAGPTESGKVSAHIPPETAAFLATLLNQGKP